MRLMPLTCQSNRASEQTTPFSSPMCWPSGLDLSLLIHTLELIAHKSGTDYGIESTVGSLLLHILCGRAVS